MAPRLCIQRLLTVNRSTEVESSTPVFRPGAPFFSKVLVSVMFDGTVEMDNLEIVVQSKRYSVIWSFYLYNCGRFRHLLAESFSY